MMNLFWVFLLLPVVWSNDDLHRPEENVGLHDKNLFEGDMILPPAQRMAAMVGGDVSKAGIGRGSIRRNLWPGGVLVYYLDPALERSSSAMNAINAAMNQWRSKTCITFKKRTNERAYAHFHIGAGCTSYVGRTGSKQMLSLARGCWWTHTVAHEIGHALGFYHEQSRPDRDNYVNIYWNNIQKGLAFAFNKYPRSTIDSLGTPYDYKSVMHYESFAFSTNRRPTIQAKDSSITLSNRKGPTEIDYKQMNLLYKCSGGGDGGNGGGGGGGDGGNGGGGGGGDGGGSNCRDNHRSCPSWARRGECRKNPRYMLRNCKKSCDKC